MTFGAESTTDDVLANLDLSGQHALVTGAASGLGTETARSLAAAGATVTLAGRNQAGLDDAAAAISAQHPAANLNTVAFDLGSLESISAGAAELVNGGNKIDLLINNAGVMNTPLSHTTNGFEMQFGINHLGHFALAAQVAELLADNARVIALSSASHLRATCELDDLNWESREYDRGLAYAHSKTANIWFASELARKWAGTGRLAFSVHPGVIPTNLTRHNPDFVPPTAGAALPPGRKSIPQGAATTVWAATAAELANHSGSYLVDCGIAKPPAEVSEPRQGYGEWTYDPASEAALWQKSQALTGIDF